MGSKAPPPYLMAHQKSRVSENSIRDQVKANSKDQSLSMIRRYTAKIVISKSFELFVGVIFASNIIFIVLETDADARYMDSEDDDHLFGWLSYVNWGYLCFYGAELALRMYVIGCNFFKIKTNIFDTVVVSVDAIFSASQTLLDQVDMPSVSILRVVRFFRLLRLARTIVAFEGLRELYVMIQGLIAALRAIFWAILLIFITLTLCSILAVQILHPLNSEISKTGIYSNCERCPRAFATVAQSTLTFIQTIIAGDSWGRTSLPIIEKHPWTMPIFVGVLLCINLGLMNLVLSAIVDQAAASRELDYTLRMREKEARFNENRDRLVRIFQGLDSDGDGFLSYDELSKGYEMDEIKRIWKMMDIGHEELTLVYDMMDHDGSGNVDYEEFINQIHDMQTRDQRILVMFLSAAVHKSTEQMNKRMDDMNEQITKLSGLRQEARCPDDAKVPAAAPEDANAIALTLDKSSESSVAALDRLAKSIENDVLSSLQDVGRIMEREVATNLRNSELLATLTKSVPSVKASEKVKSSSTPRFLDGCTIETKRAKFLVEPLPRMDAPVQMGSTVDYQNYPMSSPGGYQNGAGASSHSRAFGALGKMGLDAPSSAS